MNCFEWKNRAGDYLDGLLPPLDRKQADQHLDSCSACKQKLGQIRELLKAIGERPRSTLPVAIRKAPLAFASPRIDILNKKTRWERAPWFVRASVEGLGFAVLILFAVALIPRMRSLYDQSLERRLDAFSLVDFFRGTEERADTAGITMTRGRLAADGTAPEGAAPAVTAHTSDEFSEGEAPDAPESATEEEESIRVGRAEIWRFNLKTDSPHDMQPKIVALLLSQGLAKNTPGIGGIEAPGGIQFDLLVPSEIVANLRAQLRKLATTGPAAAPGGAATDSTAEVMDATGSTPTFTWYKNKSRRPIPAGQSRIVIWLSQM